MKKWEQLSLFSTLDLSVDPENPSLVPENYYSLHMRRYLGCKTRLLSRIDQVVQERCPDVKSVFDVFSGTGVVGHLFNTPHRLIVVNDFLASNFAILLPWFKACKGDKKEIEDTITYLQTIVGEHPNYYSRNYGDRFFAAQTACTIGAIREEIERLNLRDIVKSAAISSLLYAADSVALTCGHFDAYRGLKDRSKLFSMRLPAIPYSANENNRIFCEDGNELVKRIKTDLIYIDPPYNRRQYSTLYHVLDNITLNKKHGLVGKTRKPQIKERPKSLYSTSKASRALYDLISNSQAKHIILSYNNMTSGGSNSNALVSLEELEEILKIRGEVTVYNFPFPSFTARRNLLKGHEEYLFYCRVTKKT